MRKYILLFAIIFIFSLKINAQVALNHPRIFIDSTMMDTLQSRRIRNTTEWQKMNTWVEFMKPNTVAQILTQYEGQHYAFGFMLAFWARRDTVYRDKAVEIFKAYWTTKTDASINRDQGFDSRGMMADCAILYDWLYPYLDEPLRQQIRTRLVVWADWVMANGYGTWNGIYYYEGNNYVVGHILGISATAHAIYHEDPINGARLLGVANTQLARIKTFMGNRLKGGDANEGWSYGAGYFHNILKIFAIYKTASSPQIDHFAQTNYEEEAQKFLIFATLPNKANLLPEGDWSRESSGEIWDMNRYMTDLTSTYSNDLTTRRVARFYGAEIMPQSKWAIPAYWWNQFLFTNQEIQPLDYRTVSSYTSQNYVFTDTSGTGQFIQRNNWLANGQWASFRAGGHYGDHAHDGQGHFNLWENGWLLVDRNAINSSGIEAQDDYSNAFQFYGNNKQIKYPTRGYPNAEHSLIPRRDITSNYTYFHANNSLIYTLRTNPAYNNIVNKAERSWFYLPTQKAMVVFDNAETKSDTNTKAFRLTFYQVPTLTGNVMSYDNGTTKVFSHTAFPQNVSFFQPFDCSTCRPRNRYIDVKYTTQKKQNYFVNVIYTKGSGSTQKAISGISRNHGNVLLSDFYGTLLEGDTTNIAVLFKGDSAIYNYDSLRYRIDNSRQSRHYVTGLRLSTNYYVSKTNAGSLLDVRISLNPIPNASVIQTSSGGVLEFHHNSLFTGISFNTPVVENIKCHGGINGKIIVSASGGDNNITYSKDGTKFQASNTFLNLTSNQYTITAKDGAGISATLNVIVSQPALLTVSANNNSPFCGANTLNINATINGGTPTLSYAWSGPNSFTSSSQNLSISDATTSNQGIYTILITDANTCTATTTTSVIIYPIPDAPIVSASHTAVCGVALVTISASGCSDNILWNNGKTTMSFVDTVFVTKNYSAVCVNAGGCSSLSSNLLTVTASPTPPVAIISADKMRICDAGNVTLTATNCIGQVTWSNNMTGNIITVNLTQTTSFTATCGFRGCASCGSNSLTIEVVGNSLINLVNPTDNFSNGTVLKETNNQITATNRIFSPARVSYKAGQLIDLNAGFQAENGTLFRADVGGCN